MNLFDGTFRAVTARECSGPWGGCKDGLRFRCGLCGHRFVVGDLWRGVYANGGSAPTHGNFLACWTCFARHDTDEALIQARVAMLAEARRFWWLMDDDDLKWIDEITKGGAA